ncbi:hypothetical protein ACHHYP_05373 [Achlya hypogyna]|uniref:Calx-beta domain-containing protein n=1 Tax=Achlya hypogyna TaxID=1202772 RepID=A0A1V9YXY9_ACHHY|nr:hypothetical protein ACHHYP_05373 [Achlya hypogyna]
MRRPARGRILFIALVLFAACLQAVHASTFGFSGGYTSLASAYEATCIGVCGTQTVPLVIQRSGDTSAVQNVLVTTAAYSVAASSAVANVDYAPLSNYVVTFPAGATSQTVNINVLTAGMKASTLYFQAALSNPTTGCTIDPAKTTAYVAVMGQAGVLSFSMSNYSFSEAAGVVTIPVLRTGGSCGSITVTYALGTPDSTTAVLGTNFVMMASTSTLTLVDGQTSASISVRIIDTSVFEYYSLFFTLTLSTPTVRGSLGAFPSTYVFILDNHDAGIFAFSSDFTYCREDNGSAIVYVNRTAGSSTSTVEPVLLTVTTTSGGNATQGGSRAFDFETNTLVLSWASGETQKAFAVKVFNNAVYNPVVRSVQVALTVVSGGATISTSANATWIYIVDDRDAGTMSFRTSNYSVLENAASITLDIIRSGEPDPSGVNTYTSGVVTVDVLTNAGVVVPGLAMYDPLYDWGVVQERGCTHVSPCTAVPGVHYTAVPVTTLTFQDGESLKQVTIAITNNNFFEAPNVVFKVVLQNVQGGAFIGWDLMYPASFVPAIHAALDPNRAGVPNYVSAIVTIRDDADAAVLLSKASLSTSEIGQVDAVSVVLNAAPTAPVTLALAVGSNQLVLSAGQLVFSPANWNVPQTVIVSSAPDNVTQGIHAIPVTCSATSSDARYSGPARLTVGGTGVVYGVKVYTSPWGVYNTGNPSHEFPWSDAQNGLLTAPKPASVAVYVLDANRAAILIQPETMRHSNGRPANFVCARANGHVASVTISLASQPTANVVLTLTTSQVGVTLTPASVTLQPAQWASGAVVSVSYASNRIGRVVTGQVVIGGTSSDAFYNGKSAAFFVAGYDAAALTLNQTQGVYNENGPVIGQADYTLGAAAEPMHWERQPELSAPHQVSLAPVADISLSSFANQSASAPTLSVASNASVSTNIQSYQHVALLRFPIATLAAATGSARVGLARLQVFRVAGGENQGLGGLQLGAVVAPAAGAWAAESLSTLCAPGSCTIVDTSSSATRVVRTDLLPAGPPFGDIMGSRGQLSGLSDVIPQGTLNTATGVYTGGSGWVSIDITTAVNTLSVAGSTHLTVALYALRESPFVYGNVDEMTLASMDHPTAAWRPSLVVTSSGLVNLATTATANQSVPTGNASAVLAPTAPAMTLLLGPAWWQADLGAIYSLEAVVLTMMVPTPATFKVQAHLSLSSITAGDGVNASQAAYSRTFSVATTSPFETVRLQWHVYGSTGTLDSAGILFQPALTTLTEARVLAVVTNATLYLLAANVYQTPMAATRVVLGGNLPTPSTLAVNNVLSVAVDDPVVTDTGQCSATRVCRSEVLLTSGTWSSAQVVHVAVADDNVATGPRVGAIAHTSRSADPDYDAVAHGVCSMSAPLCTSPLQAVVSVSITDDEEAGVLFTQGSVTVVEGARNYPGAPQPTKIGTWAPVSSPTCSWNYVSKEDTSCRRAFSSSGGRPWTACTATGVTMFGNASAWTLLQLNTSMGAPLNVTVALPGNTVRVPQALSLWTSAQSSLNASLWTQLERLPVAFSAAPSQVSFSGAGMLAFNALWVEASYDATTPPWQCADIASIVVTGITPATTDSIDVSVTRLSRMHRAGTPAVVSVRLLSEPLADVDVVVSQSHPALMVFNPQNDSAGTAWVTGGTYGYASFGAYVPTKLHFTASNWNVLQLLEIAAVDDNMFNGNRSVSVVFTTTANDAAAVVPASSKTQAATGLTTSALPSSCAYASTQFIVSPGTMRAAAWPFRFMRSSTSAGSLALAVALVDDDIPGVTVSAAPLVAIENFTSGFSYTVVLDSQPASPVAVAVALVPTATSTRANLAELSSPAALLFDATTWFTPQTVTVAATYVAGFEGAEASTVRYVLAIPKADAGLMVVHTMSSADANYNGIRLATNSPGSVAETTQGVPVVAEDVDTGCAGSFEYACANGHACALGTPLGNRCNCTGVYGLRDCSSECSSASSCAFSRVSFVVACNAPATTGAACPVTFVPYNFVSAVYRLLNSTRFKSADGTAFEALALPAMEVGIYVVAATPVVDAVSHGPAVRVVVDVAEPGGQGATLAKLLALYASDWLSPVPLSVLSMEAVAVMPPSTTSGVVLYVFVALIAVGGVSVGVLTARYLRRPGTVATKTLTLIVPQPMADTHALVDHTEAVS